MIREGRQFNRQPIVGNSAEQLRASSAGRRSLHRPEGCIEIWSSPPTARGRLASPAPWIADIKSLFYEPIRAGDVDCEVIGVRGLRLALTALTLQGVSRDVNRG